MCGIVGIISLNNRAKPVDNNILRDMLDSIRGRGPDAQGVWVDPGMRVGLANARLSTLDPRPIANQPMLNAQETIAITFNGEIYNHKELRRDLESRGHKFRTRSDTEVLMYAYLAYGEEALSMLEGQFAFILYDLAQQKILIARDPIGISPLYYAIQGDYLFIASEPRALLRVPDFPRAVNQQALYHFVIMESVPLGQTLFKGIRYLRSGNYFYFNLFEPPLERRFASFLFSRNGHVVRSEDEWIGWFQSSIKDAVARRLVADKEVGVFLSGGLDSNVIAAAIRAVDPQRLIRTFSFGFQEVETGVVGGELAEARQSSDFFQTKHEEIILRPQDFIDRMGRDELPPSSIAETIFDAMARKTVDSGVEVALTGEGSDETFFGYDSYFTVISRLLPEFKHLAERYPPRNKTGNGQQPTALLDLFVGGGSDLSIEANRKAIFSENFLFNGVVRDSVRPYLEELKAVNPDSDIDKQIMYLDLCLKIPEYTLRRVERVTMGNGLELRFPFLDLRLIRAHFEMPMKFRVGGGDFKEILKKAFRGLIPQEVLQRPKSPLGLPAVRSTYYKNSPWVFPKPALAKVFNKYYLKVKQDIFDGRFVQEGIFQESWIREKLSKQRDLEQAEFDPALWKIWNLAVWYEKWVKTS